MASQICSAIVIRTCINGDNLEGRVSDFGFRISGFGFRVSGFGFRVSGFGFQVSGFGLRVDRLARQRVFLGEVREERAQGASRGILDEHAGRAVGVGGHAEQRREVRVPPKHLHHKRHKHLHLPDPTSHSIFRKMYAACSIARTAFDLTHAMD